MQDMAQLLVSTVLLLNVLNVLVQRTGISAAEAQPSDNVRIESSAAASGDPSSGDSEASSPPAILANASSDTFPGLASVSRPLAAFASEVAFSSDPRIFAYKVPLGADLPLGVLKPSQVDLVPPESSDIEEGESDEDREAIHVEQQAEFTEKSRQMNKLRVRRGSYNAPYFVGKRSLEENEELYQEELQKRDDDEDILDDSMSEVQSQSDDLQLEERASPMFVGKRQAPWFVGKRRQAPLFVGKRRQAPMFVGKRQAPLFVGKRRLAPLFIGKRRAPYFVGKRKVPMFVGKREDPAAMFFEESQAPIVISKRAVPMFVGKRPSPMFVGKRPSPMFVGKRPSPMFVGKRPSPMFVGKRPSPMFVGKRPSPMFVGKRPSPMFVGKRPSPMFVGKRPSPMFVGKRPSPMFVGKRPSPMFVGKRPSPMFVGKRPSPMFVGKRPSPMFVGKRKEEHLNDLLAALHTLQAARHYRRMIQTDKRHNAPFFVGRRSSTSSEDSSESKDD